MLHSTVLGLRLIWVELEVLESGMDIFFSWIFIAVTVLDSIGIKSFLILLCWNWDFLVVVIFHAEICF